MDLLPMQSEVGNRRFYGFYKVLLRRGMFSFDGQKRTRKPPAISMRWIHEKGAARPFQTPKMKAALKKAEDSSLFGLKIF